MEELLALLGHGTPLPKPTTLAPRFQFSQDLMKHKQDNLNPGHYPTGDEHE